MAQKTRLNTLWDIMIMMLLVNYVYDFRKWLVMLKKFNENVTMSFRVNNKQLLKNYNKIL